MLVSEVHGFETPVNGKRFDLSMIPGSAQSGHNARVTTFFMQTVAERVKDRFVETQITQAQ